MPGLRLDYKLLPHGRNTAHLRGPGFPVTRMAARYHVAGSSLFQISVMRLDKEHDRLDGARLSRRWWSIAIVILALPVVIGGYRWNRERMWTLSGSDGRSVCRVQAGWTEQDVAAHCGPRSGRGQQPKVPSGTGAFDLRMCSAPGDVYGTKVVLYGCDG